MWSGDTSASWKTFRNQISAGLNFCASGLPYWTADIGAFFVKDGDSWYWDGKYDDTTNDPAYLELYTRWYQWCCFFQYLEDMERIAEESFGNLMEREVCFIRHYFG